MLAAAVGWALYSIYLFYWKSKLKIFDRFAMISFEKIAFKIILNIRRLNPKCETVCEKFL